MKDPLFIILSTLNSIISNMMKIFTFVFVNYFPSPVPEEPDIFFRHIALDVFSLPAYINYSFFCVYAAYTELGFLACCQCVYRIAMRGRDH